MWGPSGSCKAQGTAAARAILKHTAMENSGHPSVLFTPVGAWINTDSQYPAQINLRGSLPRRGFQATARAPPGGEGGSPLAVLG